MDGHRARGRRVGARRQAPGLGHRDRRAQGQAQRGLQIHRRARQGRRGRRGREGRDARGGRRHRRQGRGDPDPRDRAGLPRGHAAHPQRAQQGHRHRPRQLRQPRRAPRGRDAALRLQAVGPHRPGRKARHLRLPARRQAHGHGLPHPPRPGREAPARAHPVHARPAHPAPGLHRDAPALRGEHRLHGRHRPAAEDEGRHVPLRGRRLLADPHRRGPRHQLLPRRHPRRRPAPHQAHRLHPLLPPRGRQRGQGHPRHPPRPPVRQGRDGEIRRPRDLLRRAREAGQGRRGRPHRPGPALPRPRALLRRHLLLRGQVLRHRALGPRPAGLARGLQLLQLRELPGPPRQHPLPPLLPEAIRPYFGAERLTPAR